MKKNIFAVCDLETDYAVNFMEYLNQKRNIPFEIQAFTTRESLMKFGKNRHIELLLISGKAMCREIREMDIGKIIILSEGVHSPELDQYPSVYKYQSSSNVLREVMSCYGEQKAPVAVDFPVLKKQTVILGVYSPLHRCLKTSIALTLGQILAKQKPVLYLNLEEYSGFEELMNTSYGGNLSDLLYYVRQENQNLIHLMNGMVQTVGNLDLIPPVKTPWDIRSTVWEDWERLLAELEKNSSYEVILLDIGSEVDEIFQMLDRCSRIYMPVLSDTLSVCKLAQYEKLVKLWDYDRILEKTTRLSPPFHVEKGTGEAYVRQLIWSELGDYIRECLRREKRKRSN